MSRELNQMGPIEFILGLEPNVIIQQIMAKKKSRLKNYVSRNHQSVMEEILWKLYQWQQQQQQRDKFYEKHQ